MNRGDTNVLDIIKWREKSFLGSNISLAKVLKYSNATLKECYF